MASKRIDEDLVRRLAALLEETGLTEIEYGTDDWRVRVAKRRDEVTVTAPAAPAATAPVSAAAPDAQPESEPGAVTSPMVGTVYLSPEPGAPTYVKVGDQVEAGKTLLLIEAMKTFNEIRAPRAGVIAEIRVHDRMPVEYGDVLMILS